MKHSPSGRYGGGWHPLDKEDPRARVIEYVPRTPPRLPADQQSQVRGRHAPEPPTHQEDPVTCPARYLDVAREALLSCALDAGHEDLHVEAGPSGAPALSYPVKWWSVGDIEQVRGSHAPAPRGATWSPAAMESLLAAEEAAGKGRVVLADVARERRASDAALLDQLVADAKAAGALEERAAATQRVYAWAATLSKTDEALIAAKAAEVVQAGR